jgi:nucleoside-diphosphate-sugar epimerase
MFRDTNPSAGPTNTGQSSVKTNLSNVVSRNKADLTDKDDVDRIITKDLDIVFQVAAHTDTNYDDRRLFEENTETITEACRSDNEAYQRVRRRSTIRRGRGAATPSVGCFCSTVE